MLYLLFKRLFDIFFSLIILTTISPLLLLIACLIKLSSKGPVFYSSMRIGAKFKPIYCLKFRTMHADADERLKILLKKNKKAAKEWAFYQKLKNDPRVHPLGSFLRKTSLDELPQFLNVLKGDLSIVGPRPFLEDQITTFLGKKADKFLSIKPGITGIWQVSGRNLLTFKERLALEEHYINHPSFLTDFKIILKTIPTVLFRKGAY